jgi:hypothetical protein
MVWLCMVDGTCSVATLFGWYSNNSIPSSYNEMRAAYEVANQSGWDVYIGSHTIANPAGFLSQVRDLEKTAGSSRFACLHGSMSLIDGNQVHNPK